MIWMSQKTRRGYTLVSLIPSLTSPVLTRAADAEKCAGCFKECVTAISEIIQSSTLGRNGFPLTVVDELRTYSAIWYTWLFRLHRHSRATLDNIAALRMVLEGWMQLGLALNFYVASEHNDATPLGTRLCFWGQCEFHQKPSPKSLSVCKGCREARYCSSSCQHRYELRGIVDASTLTSSTGTGKSIG